MDIRGHANWQLVCALPVVGALGCMPRTVPDTSNAPRTNSYIVGSGAVVQFRVDPRSKVRGPVVHVDGAWDVRVETVANAYVVYVTPRGSAGAVHIVAGPHDDVRVQIGRLPSAPPQTVSYPTALVPSPYAAPSVPTVAKPSNDDAPKSAAEEQPGTNPAPASSSARQRLRGTLDTSDPWAP